MSYLKKFNDDNLKENYNKYGFKPNGAVKPVKATDYVPDSGKLLALELKLIKWKYCVVVHGLNCIFPL